MDMNGTGDLRQSTEPPPPDSKDTQEEGNSLGIGIPAPGRDTDRDWRRCRGCKSEDFRNCRQRNRPHCLQEQHSPDDGKRNH